MGDVLVCKLILLVSAIIFNLLWVFFGTGEFITRGPACLNILLVYLVGFPVLQKPFQWPKHAIIFVMQYFPLASYGLYLGITCNTKLHFQLLISYILGIVLIIVTASTVFLEKIFQKQDYYKDLYCFNSYVSRKILFSRTIKNHAMVTRFSEDSPNDTSENEVRIVPFVPPPISKPPNMIHQFVTADIHDCSKYESESEIPKVIDIKKKPISRRSYWFIKRPHSPVVTVLATLFWAAEKNEDSSNSVAFENEVTWVQDDVTVEDTDDNMPTWTHDGVTVDNVPTWMTDNVIAEDHDSNKLETKATILAKRVKPKKIDFDVIEIV